MGSGEWLETVESGEGGVRKAVKSGEGDGGVRTAVESGYGEGGVRKAMESGEGGGGKAVERSLGRDLRSSRVRRGFLSIKRMDNECDSLGGFICESRLSTRVVQILRRGRLSIGKRLRDQPSEQRGR